MSTASRSKANCLSRLLLTGLGLLLSAFGTDGQEPGPASSQTASPPRVPNQPLEKSSSKQAALRLTLQKPMERELRGGGADTYEIKVRKGHFLRFVAEQKGIDVVLVLTDPSGKVLVEADSPNGTWGPEPASVIAATAGIYGAQVKSMDKNAAVGKYSITVAELREAKAEDETRIEAERTMFAAGRQEQLQQKDSLQKAVDLYEKAIQLWHTVPESYEEALCMTEIGTIYGNLGKNQEALGYDDRALPLYRAAGDRNGEATILNNMGLVYSSLGEKQKALEYYYQALPAIRAAGNSGDEAKVLSNIGLVLSDVGENQKALEYFGEALPLHRVVGDRIGEATTLNNICNVYAILGKQEKALEQCEQALSVLHAVGHLIGEATTLNNIGMVYSGFGEMQKALEHYKQALPLSRASGDRYLEAMLLNNIGGIYGDLGEVPKQLEYYNQALPLARSIGDRTGEATDLNNIGSAYSYLGEKRKALDFYNQALPLRRAVGDRDGEAFTLNNIALAYLDLGEKQKALEHYNQALTLLRAVGDRSGEALVLDNMAGAYLALGEKQKALDYLSDALVLYRAVQDLKGEGTTLNHLMRYWKKEQSPGVAIFFGKQSVNVYQRIRRNIQGLDAGLQKSFLESQANVYRDLGDLLISQGRLLEAQQVLDLLKEQEYFEFVRGGGNSMEARSQPISLNPEEQSSHEAYEKIAGQITAAGAEFSELRAKRMRTPDEETRMAGLKEKLVVANQEMERFFKTLYVEFGKNAQANRSAEDVREDASGMQSIVRALGSGTVALYTLVGESRYSVIVITGSTMQAREYAIDAVDLRRKVAAFLEALKNPASDPLPASQELYKILIGPIADDLKGARAQTLMWSLNDVLRYVPMAALHDGKQYFVENYRNVVITPASIGRLKDKVDVSNSSIAGMGVSKDYDGLGSLSAVPQELKHIVRDNQVQGATGVIPGIMMLDDDFTEAKMASALDKHYPVVHIASHFVLQAGNETNSYLLLGGKDVGGKGYHLTLAELRDDPALTFDGTELLTLSACQTGTSGTALNGREVDGLGITAQQKGAKAVLASLWSVADESTALLMADFYKQWLGTAGTTKASALQRAQLVMLHGAPKANNSGAATASNTKNAADKMPASSYSHPFYWAPFILIGNWK